MTIAIGKPKATSAQILPTNEHKVAVAATPAARAGVGPAARVTLSSAAVEAARKAPSAATASNAKAAAPAAKPAAAAAVSTTAAEVAPAKSAAFVAGEGHVVVDVQNSDSGFDNRIYYSTDGFKTKNYIGVDNHVGSVDLGSFAAGTKLEFGVDNGQGGFFTTGGAAANSDGFDHAQVSTTASGTQIGFEDLRGGGDRDFNDAIIQVRNVSNAAPAPPPAAQPESALPAATAPATTATKPAAEKSAPAPSATKTAKDTTNRSGLADGTNPGQGAGRANSPNQGTNNPNQAKTKKV